MRRIPTVLLLAMLAPLGGCAVVSATGAVVSAAGTAVGAAATVTETAVDTVAGGDDEECEDGRTEDGEDC